MFHLGEINFVIVAGIEVTPEVCTATFTRWQATAFDRDAG